MLLNLNWIIEHQSLSNKQINWKVLCKEAAIRDFGFVCLWGCEKYTVPVLSAEVSEHFDL